MNNKVYEVKLDMKRATSTRGEWVVVEGDNGNKIEITLTDDGAPVNLSNCRVLAVFGKPDGTTVEQDTEGNGLTVSGDDHNIITIELYAGSFSPGPMKCEIQVYSGGNYGTLITSAQFTFKCRRGIMNSDTVQSVPEYPILLSATAAAEEATAEALAAAATARSSVQSDWTEADAENPRYIQHKPTAFTPSAHASTHANGGADAITPDDIGAAAAADFATHASRHAVGEADATTKRFSATFASADWDETDFIQAKTNVSGGSVAITPATFKTEVSETVGTYVFTYADATTEWKLDDTGVTLADYGIVLTGSPSDEDTITAQYKVCHVQTVSVTGVTSDMVMKVDLSLSESALIDDRLAQVEAFSLVGRIDSAAGEVTLTCYDGAPEVDFSVQMEVAL